VYAREFDGKEHNFGVVGVDEGTLIMYDDETDSHWSQLFGKAVRGSMEGTALAKLPSTMTTWGAWRKLHPDTSVYVKRSTPYARRFTQESFAKIASMDPGPIRSDDLVIGLEGHVDARAYLVRGLKDTRLVEENFEGEPILVVLSEDLATARVLSRRLSERTLDFRLGPDGDLIDTQTGSTWDPVSGVATAGELAGQSLRSLISTYSVWFAWKHYRPDTTVYER